MLIVKKVLAAFLLPPGIFVALLLVAGVLLMRSRQWRWGLLNIGIAFLIWAASITPVSQALLQRLESGLSLPDNISGDVIILLGAGTNYRAVDMSGTGFPSGAMLARMATAFRLHRQLKIPILATSGSVYKGQEAGSRIIKRLFLDWGVSASDLIIETESRDTAENARFSARICKKKGFVNPILVTSASHLKRAQLLFKRAGLTVAPFPDFLSTGNPRPFTWHSFLPNEAHLSSTAKALHEYLGLVYYRLIWW